MSVRLLHGDARTVLPTLDAASVQCCVCSPPYFGLRRYLAEGHEDAAMEIGGEATPDAYIAALVGVFRELRRVLRDDGTCWVNLGDGYAGGPQSAVARSGEYVGDGGKAPPNVRNRNGIGAAPGYKPKDLMMMPARVALALQADGWWLRSDIIWAKPNPMPESVTDRPTSAHEHVFLLTKAARYYYDADAVREEAITVDMRRPYGSEGAWQLDGRPTEQRHGGEPRKVKVPGGWDRGEGAHGTIHRDGRTSAEYQEAVVKAGRNLRNVWTIATAPYADAHFATFPPELAERCIKAGTSERGCCAHCAAPWVRMQARSAPDFAAKRGLIGKTDSGWSQSCACPPSDPVPCVMLDPFCGAATALLVASRLGRNAVGVELNSDYVKLGLSRIEKDAGLFADVEAQPSAAPRFPSDAPADALPASVAPNSPDRRLAYSGLNDAQASLWE